MNIDSLRDAYVVAYKVYSREVDKTHQLLMGGNQRRQGSALLAVRGGTTSLRMLLRGTSQFLEAIQTHRVWQAHLRRLSHLRRHAVPRHSANRESVGGDCGTPRGHLHKARATIQGASRTCMRRTHRGDFQSIANQSRKPRIGPFSHGARTRVA